MQHTLITIDDKHYLRIEYTDRLVEFRRLTDEDAKRYKPLRCNELDSIDNVSTVMEFG